LFHAIFLIGGLLFASDLKDEVAGFYLICHYPSLLRAVTDVQFITH